jgi:hypothetical protein
LPDARSAVRILSACCALTAALFLSSAARGQQLTARLVDVAARAGVTLLNICGDAAKDFIVDSNGTGAAWLTLTFAASAKPDPARMAIVGACVAGAYTLIGAIVTQFLPEPKPELDESAPPTTQPTSARVGTG